MKRTEKIALLSGIIKGQVNPQQLQRMKHGREPWYMVVSNSRPLQDEDFVEVRSRRGGALEVIQFADFKRNLSSYQPMCIQVDEPFRQLLEESQKINGSNKIEPTNNHNH